MQPLSKAILYPTITSDVLQLDLPETTEYALAIVDLTGREIYSSRLATGKRQCTVEVDELRAGTYSLLLTNKTGFRQALRFVKR